jgi:hypothetical protein
MSKPYLHSQSSVKKWGGQNSDYIEIHDWFDQTKAHFGSNVHRAILHSSFGIFLCEQVYGHTITNSDDREVSVRDIGEQHVLEDLGFIPTVSDYLENLEYQPWMSKENGAERPSSQKKLGKKKPKVTEIPFEEVYDGTKDPDIRPLNPLPPERNPITPIPFRPWIPSPNVIPFPYKDPWRDQGHWENPKTVD